MIKVYNKKSLAEINEMREKGLYNPSFSLVDKVDELGEAVDSFPLSQAEAITEVYEAMKALKTDIEQEQAEAVVGLYESLGGGLNG